MSCGIDDVVAALGLVGKIVTAPGSILSASSRSTTSPPSSSVLHRSRNASCSITTTRSSKPEPGGVIRRRPRPSACSGRIFRRRGERAQRDDHAHVAHVPALAQHQHADDAADRAVGPVDVPRGLARDVEVGLRDLARAVRVDHEQPVAGEVRKLAQVVAGLVGGLRVLAHHEQHRPLARRRERLVEHAPAPDGDVEPLAGCAGTTCRPARPSRPRPRR